MTVEIAPVLRAVLGADVRVEAISSGGYSGARKYRALLSSGETVFVKHAVTPYAREQLVREVVAYEGLSVETMLKLVAHTSNPPLLVLEDASQAHWPPPWRPGDVERVVGALDELHRQLLPKIIRLEDFGPQLRGGWSAVAQDPSIFLKLKLCGWSSLRRMLPSLVRIDQENDFRGSSVSHLDLRSDNVCFMGPSCRFVDWAYFSAASPELDFVLWLPSLIDELGMMPDELVRYSRHRFMVSFAGYLAARAGLPEPHGSSGRVRDIQLRQLRIAFPLARAIVGIA